MGPFSAFLLVYVLGGLTFIPLVLSLLVLHAYLTLPGPLDRDKAEAVDVGGLERKGDDEHSLNSRTAELAEKFQRPREADVAAGYFAVCREYVPGGVNGKPPERTTPAGEVIATESPSVYQSVYRSIFDRKQVPTLDANKGNGRNVRKARNVFYVILRHGHLMLYDDAEQIEVRYVISLAHHNVSIYGGGDLIPEGELWIKRNAICLSRKPEGENIPGPRPPTLPFYLFSENLSEKEDFYFAILNNLDRIPGSIDSPPTPRQFATEDMVTLVQRLHSSEEHLQTRWFNALLGRLFLALYKTPELEQFIRGKITKKISRVNKPNFITKLELQAIHSGEGAPLITNPRLKDLTVNGDCCIEADVNYSGNFRVEIAATARIELGTRFKPREVDLILAVVLKKLKGHILLRFKPPPSNRLWISFETMPTMEMTIEPIVSSRQITYGIILRAIESRIREVVAETLVQPFWDDIPFLDTEEQHFRGGIWEEAQKAQEPEVTDKKPEKEETPDATPGATPGTGTPESSKEHTTEEHDASNVVPDTPSQSQETLYQAFTNSINEQETSEAQETDFRPSSLPDIPGKAAHSAPKHRSTRSLSFSPATSGSSLFSPTISTTQWNDPTEASTPTSESGDTATPLSRSHSDHGTNPASVNDNRINRSNSLAAEGIKSSKSTSASPNLAPGTFEPRQAMLTIGTAAAAAKKWGMSVLTRHDQSPRPGEVPDHPVGRGRPLPPPGTPLPSPGRFNFGSIAMPKRKPVAPSLIASEPSPSVSKQQLSKRQDTVADNDTGDQELLVIKAPVGSEPSSPVKDRPDHGDMADESDDVPDAWSNEVLMDFQDSSFSNAETISSPSELPQPTDRPDEIKFD
ncbi:putative PH domain-containing protein [Arthroderma uncinatum]|uniref:putative PH domain-containing protein n=1 Tax=Arthroderma uncinatum TaxID=74035 RepID=UPI00144A5C57|nr:putative PH domain-containing protein [Arthroderma uncinatum]KAF3482315.1 putative PH domain-containing protein [Arthroderma uncinatum]